MLFSIWIQTLRVTEQPIKNEYPTELNYLYESLKVKQAIMNWNIALTNKMKESGSEKRKRKKENQKI